MTVEALKIPESRTFGQRVPVILAGLEENSSGAAESLVQDQSFDVQVFALSWSDSDHFVWRNVGDRRFFLARTWSWPTNVPEKTIVVDYTSANVEENVGFYVSRQIPFVMASIQSVETLRQLNEMVKKSSISAVVLGITESGADIAGNTIEACRYLAEETRRGTVGRVFTGEDVRKGNVKPEPKYLFEL